MKYRYLLLGLLAMAAVAVVKLNLAVESGHKEELRRCRGRIARLEAQVAAARRIRTPAQRAAAPAAAPDRQVAAPPAPVRVSHVRFYGSDGEPGLEFLADTQPVTPDLMKFIEVSPSPGPLTPVVRSSWNWRGGGNCYCVRLLGGRFEFGRPYTLRIRAGLPFKDGRTLKSDVTRTVTREDLPAKVDFADFGRYLTPSGDRLLALKTVNTTNVCCTVCAVLPENVVQLLAREEGRYTDTWWWPCVVDADSAATRSLARPPVEWSQPVVAQPNREETVFVSLDAAHGAPSNGVYLVSAGVLPHTDRGDRRRHEFKLVCVSDLGLSVRRDADSVRVWVTSIARARPVPQAEVRVYADNRQELACAVTDARGEAVCALPGGAPAPFAVVVRSGAGDDCAFLALGPAAAADEPAAARARPRYLADGAASAFVWTDRGIYRHGERIMVHALLRGADGSAPAPFPVKLALVRPDGKIERELTVTPDGFGALMAEDLSVADDRPSGRWRIRVALPGEGGAVLGERTVSVEDFAPPQVRVALAELPEGAAADDGISFVLHAEHLFGGPARNLPAEGVVIFEDAKFSPAAWPGFRFGDSRRKLMPNLERIEDLETDDEGSARFRVAFKPGIGEPAAAVRMVVQGSVVEAGGRAATVRGECTLHRYPAYFGVKPPERIAVGGMQDFAVAAVRPDGGAAAPSAAAASLWRVERVYSLRRGADGLSRWTDEEVRIPVVERASVAFGADGRGKVSVPVADAGEYEFVVADGADASGGADAPASCCVRFWAWGGGDDELRAKMSNPSAVEIVPDRDQYHEGDRPRLLVKSPFAGTAWLAVMREKVLYTRTLELTNRTSEVVLDPLERDWAPNVDVALSVVRPMAADVAGFSSRARGVATLRVRPRDVELPVKVDAEAVRAADGGAVELVVRVTAAGACATGETAVVTVVDEGVNLLTGEPVPDPLGFFTAPRRADRPLYDLFSRLLPVYGDWLARSGVKTGGGADASLLSRVSAVPSRRFRPLALWRSAVALEAGVGETRFRLPEFAGEVRVTAVAYNRRAAGAAAAHVKVAPKLVASPDAPRFAAPGDVFDVTLELANRSGADGEVEYEITAADGAEPVRPARGGVRLADGASARVTAPVRALAVPGPARIVFRARGFGEEHEREIELPVRPAVAWSESAGVRSLAPGEALRLEDGAGDSSLAAATRRRVAVGASRAAELAGAIEYLAEYPYGCLEQTTSRMMPLVAAGGFLSRLPAVRRGVEQDAEAAVAAGVARVLSMMRRDGFVMWPDVDTAPWSRDVSLYAAHFLVAAEAAGNALPPGTGARLRSLLGEWAYDSSDAIGVYACHTLALAGAPDRDRMDTFYDERERLQPLDRARLARAFARIGELARARTLLHDAGAPDSVQTAAFALVALLETDPADGRIGALAQFLHSRRGRERLHWGTTADNAHALAALSAYYRSGAGGTAAGEVRVRVRGASDGDRVLPDGGAAEITGGGGLEVVNEGEGTAVVSWRRLALPDAAAVTNESSVLRVERRLYRLDGSEADLAAVRRGDLLVAEILVDADGPRRISDIVVQALLPAGLEPESQAVAARFAEKFGRCRTYAVLRSEVRDDRALAFLSPTDFEPGLVPAGFYLALRAVSAGEFTLPGASAAAMYAPEIRAVGAPGKVRVK